MSKLKLKDFLTEEIVEVMVIVTGIILSLLVASYVQGDLKNSFPVVVFLFFLFFWLWARAKVRYAHYRISR